MGKRGPKPKPTRLRVLEGNPSKRPLNDQEPEPSGEAVCPDYLSDDAKAAWSEIMASLPPGMITAADAPLLAAYCEAVATHKAAVESLAARGVARSRCLLVHGKPAPQLRIMAEAARTMATLGTRLGLSPADRSGLKGGGPGEGKSKWTGLIS